MRIGEAERDAVVELDPRVRRQAVGVPGHADPQVRLDPPTREEPREDEPPGEARRADGGVPTGHLGEPHEALEARREPGGARRRRSPDPLAEGEEPIRAEEPEAERDQEEEPPGLDQHGALAPGEPGELAEALSG